MRVLSLIEEYEGGLRLTPTGRERITHSRIVHSQAGEALGEAEVFMVEEIDLRWSPLE